MAKRRPAGDGMVRKREDGRWEGRIVIGHKGNGEPLFRHVYAKTQKALLDKLHQNIECYRDVELTEEQKSFIRLRRDEMRTTYGAAVFRLMLCEEMLRRNMVADFQTYRSVFCPEGGDVPWALHRAG